MAILRRHTRITTVAVAIVGAALLQQASAQAAATHSSAAIELDTTADLTERISQWDAAWEKLRKSIWDTQFMAIGIDRDLRGRRFHEDLRDYVLTRDTETKLRALRKQLTQAIEENKTDITKRVLSELELALIKEFQLLSNIGDTWFTFQPVAKQRDLWKKIASMQPTYHTPDSILELETQAVSKLNQGRFDTELLSIYEQLKLAYTQERTKLIGTMPKRGELLTYYSRRTTCTAPVKASSGKPQPRLLTTSFPEYPSASRRASEQGTVMATILVSEQGCVVSYAIAVSSGWPALDDAALDWLETASFAPAERDSKAAESWVTLPVIFKLAD